MACPQSCNSRATSESAFPPPSQDIKHCFDDPCRYTRDVEQLPDQDAITNACHRAMCLHLERLGGTIWCDGQPDGILGHCILEFELLRTQHQDLSPVLEAHFNLPLVCDLFNSIGELDWGTVTNAYPVGILTPAISQYEEQLRENGKQLMLFCDRRRRVIERTHLRTGELVTTTRR